MNVPTRHRWWASAAPWRHVALVIALTSALLFTPGVSPLAAESVDLRCQAVVEGNAQAVADKNVVCGGCHGPDGNSLVPDFPSLAGQSATYSYLQLRAYKTGARPSEIMKPQVESLSDQELKDLAAHYASLRPKASSPAASETAADPGRDLFIRGDVTRGIPPCQGCHGATAQGVQVAKGATGRPATAWHTYPTLAGQQANYVVAQLQAYQTGARADSSNARIMQAVARGLDEQAMRQIAAYVSQLPRE